MATDRKATVVKNKVAVSEGQSKLVQDQLDQFVNQDNRELIRGPLELTRNMISSWFERFIVSDGTAVVVLVDGKLFKVLSAGSYNYQAFPLFSNFPRLPRVQLSVVNLKERELEVKTDKELTLTYSPENGQSDISVQVGLDVVVTYQVVSPAIVAHKVEGPLTRLHADIIKVMREVVARLDFREFLDGGSAGEEITAGLQQLDTVSRLGLQVTSTRIFRPRGIEKLIEAEHKIYLAEQERKANEAKAPKSLTPGYVAKHHPELFSQIFGDQGKTDEHIIDAAATALKIHPGALSMFAKVVEEFRERAKALTPPEELQVLPPAQFIESTTHDTLHLLERERNNLEREHRVSTQFNQANNRYVISAVMFGGEGEVIAMEFECTDHYPNQPPTMCIKVDGEKQSFVPEALKNWTANSCLLTLVTAIKTAFA